ncbi:hypothetical protein CYMTET_4061 [Cymbomonas tetramitiformis]|uniref:RNase H type-1 domain-containing protein n=1 Tax=Cymbomonas tetramitiformis TaxID=36881 RepID=A0AAE0H248_9CHLO|nr:hypothetical protein CYMTET_4061 [Cymbomonas tetramitiformis]
MWDEIAQTKVVRYPDSFWPEHEPGCQERRWSLVRDDDADPRDIAPNQTQPQTSYPNPERAHVLTEYLYTDGNRREMEIAEGNTEWASGAAVWDLRKGEGESHKLRWDGEDQTVDRTELIAIQKAVTLVAYARNATLTVSTDSLNSIRQLEKTRTKLHSMEHHQQRDLLYAMLVNIEALVTIGKRVMILKVKAHVGINGNEKADETAKQACTTGEPTEAWDNDETIHNKSMVPDGDSEKRELAGKNTVQKYATALLRGKVAQGNTRLTAKLAALQARTANKLRIQNRDNLQRQSEDMSRTDRIV